MTRLRFYLLSVRFSLSTLFGKVQLSGWTLTFFDFLIRCIDVRRSSARRVQMDTHPARRVVLMIAKPPLYSDPGHHLLLLPGNICRRTNTRQ
ncbi:MAG: hypothetical protein BYD32DRAFT_425735 [Podila humilis]|nr:MAG: hypothetical protein BYD32DRAFT_425735 [Podila humilis]